MANITSQRLLFNDYLIAANKIASSAANNNIFVSEAVSLGEVLAREITPIDEYVYARTLSIIERVDKGSLTAEETLIKDAYKAALVIAQNVVLANIIVPSEMTQNIVSIVWNIGAANYTATLTYNYAAVSAGTTAKVYFSVPKTLNTVNPIASEFYLAATVAADGALPLIVDASASALTNLGDGTLLVGKYIYPAIQFVDLISGQSQLIIGTPSAMTSAA